MEQKTEWITVKWNDTYGWCLCSKAGKTREDALRMLEYDRQRYPGAKLDIEEVRSDDMWYNSPWGCD